MLDGPKRIAIVRALAGLGDLLCVIPALRAIRSTLPHADLVFVGVPAARAVIARFSPYIDRMLELPAWPGLPETLPLEHGGGSPAMAGATMEGRGRRVQEFLSAAAAEEFDWALQMHGSGEISNELTELLGAKVTAGYYLPGNRVPDPDRYLIWSEKQSEPRRWLTLVSHLGMQAKGEYLEFPISSEDRAGCARLTAEHCLEPGQYVCIHPGATSTAKRWSPTHFAKVADRLAGEGHQIVLTGSAKERGVTADVREAMDRQAVDLAGKTGLGELAALLEGARLLVCNDTGVSHLAAALRAPSVAVFTNSDPVRWAPANRRLHRVVVPAGGGRLYSAAEDEDPVQWVLKEADCVLARHAWSRSNNVSPIESAEPIAVVRSRP